MSVKTLKDDTKKVIQTILALSKKDLLVGIPATKNSRKKGVMTNSEIGYILDKGSPQDNIPARPWLVPGFMSVQKEVVKVLEESMSKIFTSKGAFDVGFNKSGLVAQNGIKRYIKDSSHFTPLSPVTLRLRKKEGFAGEKPLIRTSQLINSVSYVIESK